MATSLSMTRSEREAFLTEVHVGVIGIERAGAAPLCVPIWYGYDPTVGVWVITERGSQKGRALAAAGRFALCAQSETPPYRYVSVEGPVTSVRPATLEGDRRPISRRYLGVELGDRFAESDLEGTDNLVFTMRPERWRTVDYAKLPGGL